MDPPGFRRHESHNPKVRQRVPRDIHHDGIHRPHPRQRTFELLVHKDSGHKNTTPQERKVAILELDDSRLHSTHVSPHIHEQPTTHRRENHATTPTSRHAQNNNRFTSYPTTSPTEKSYLRPSPSDSDETLASLNDESIANDLDETIHVAITVEPERQQPKRTGIVRQAGERGRSRPSCYRRRFPASDQPFYQPHSNFPTRTVAHSSSCGYPVELALNECSAHVGSDEAETIIQFLEVAVNEDSPHAAAPRFTVLPTPISQVHEVPSLLHTPLHSDTFEGISNEELQIRPPSPQTPRQIHSPANDYDEALVRQLEGWNWELKDLLYDVSDSTKPSSSTATPSKRQRMPPKCDAAMARMLRESEDIPSDVSHDIIPEVPSPLMPRPVLPLPEHRCVNGIMDEARIATQTSSTRPAGFSPILRFTVVENERFSDQCFRRAQTRADARSQSDTEIYIEELVEKSLAGTDRALEVLCANGELSNEMFEIFIELGPQLVDSLLRIQEALGLKTKHFQRLPHDEYWRLCRNSILTSLTENLTRYLKVVTKLQRARAEKFESFMGKLEQYVRKLDSLMKKLTASYEQEQRHYVDECLSKERQGAYQSSKDELARRKRWDNERQQAKQRREAMHFQRHYRQGSLLMI